MKTKLILLFLLMNVFALSLSHDAEVLIIPGETHIINVVALENKSITYGITCQSELQTKCPSYIHLISDKETKIPIEVTANLRGVYPLDLIINNERSTIFIISANQTRVFYDNLKAYENNFEILKLKHGEHPLIEKGFILVESGWNLYYSKDYMPINQIFSELQRTVNEYYEILKQKNNEIEFEETQTIKLGNALFPLLILGLLAFLTFKKKKEKTNTPDINEIKKLVITEFGGQNNG